MDPKEFKPVKKYINKKIRNIIQDFEILEVVEDGCDKEGIFKWITCKNGYYGRSFTLDVTINKELHNLHKFIIESGFKFKGTTYYFDSVKLKNFIDTNYKKFKN